MNNVNVNDQWLFRFAYPIMGISFVHIGNDNTFRELIRIPSYYTDILISLGVLYLVGYYIKTIYQRLDQQSSWAESTLRFRYLFLWGLLVPTCFSLLVEVVYLRIIDIPISESSIFYLELPIVLGFLLLINLIYFILYSRQHAVRLKTELSDLEKRQPEKPLLVKQGKQNIQVPYEKIAYFILKDKLTFLVTVDGKQHLFDKTMKEVLEQMPAQDFYRLNRQIIAKRTSIITSKPTDTRKLKVELSPSVNDTFIAKANVSAFLRWLEGA